jgi:hypothetical protein
MKNILNLLFLIFFLQLFISCDPPHYIDFINKTDSNVKIKLNLKTEFENYDLERISSGDSVVFNLKQKDTANLDFGIGTWSDKEIEELTKSIKNIEIETVDKKTIYKSEKSIKKILQSNRHGFWFKTKIEIDVE